MIWTPYLFRIPCAVSFTIAFSAAAVVQQDRFQVDCGRGIYGWPKLEDCHTLLEKFADYQDHSLRFFDEEQIRLDTRGSWLGVGDIVGPSRIVPIVQLPRYYTFNTCNFALMSYAGGEGDCSGLGGTSWGKINAGGTFMTTKCLRNPGDPSGGVVVIPSVGSPTKAALSLFMWESGSIFDGVMNAFTNNPAPMIPAPGNRLSSNWTFSNVTGVASNLL